MKKKNIIILVSIGALLIIISTFFVSFGYLSSQIISKDGKSSSFLNQIIKVEYSDGTEKLITKESNNFIPGSTIEKTFNIKNIGNKDIFYSIKLDKVENTFERLNDITYELYLNDTLINTNTFPTTTSTIAYNLFLKQNDTNNFKLVVKYNNSTENQIVDSGKIINAIFSFEELPNALDNIIVYGNTILSDNITSMGELINNSEDINYNKYKLNLNVDEKTYNIYLDNTLKCISDTCDYINLKERKLVRKIGTINLNSNLEYTYENNAVVISGYNVSQINNKLLTDLIGYNVKSVNSNIIIEIDKTIFENILKENKYSILYVKDKEDASDVVVPYIYDINPSDNITLNANIEASNVKIEYK